MSCKDIKCKYYDTDMEFNCSHGVIVQSCYKEPREKLTGNKVIFESEEDFIEFMKDVNYGTYYQQLVNAREKGYIRKDIVEEAEEMLRLNAGIIPLTELEQKLIEAIQYLKAKNERLRK